MDPAMPGIHRTFLFRQTSKGHSGDLPPAVPELLPTAKLRHLLRAHTCLP
jgi:hypothetical protein